MTGKPGSVHWLDRSWAPRARRVRQSAEAQPATTCCRCGLTMAEHTDHRTGRRGFWCAARQPDGQLRAAVSVCLFADNAVNLGAKHLVLSRSWTTPSADEVEVDPWVIVV